MSYAPTVSLCSPDLKSAGQEGSVISPVSSRRADFGLFRQVLFPNLCPNLAVCWPFGLPADRPKGFTPDLLDANGWIWTFAVVGCVGCSGESLFKALAMLASDEFCWSYCGSAGIPGIGPHGPDMG